MHNQTLEPEAATHPRAAGPLAPRSAAASVDVPTAPRWLAALGWAGLLALIAAQVYGFTASAPDRGMGNLQKIMYVHVPTAWNGMLAFTVSFVASVLYAWKRRERWDLLAAATAEVGVVLTATTLALGSIWGRPTWGVWWTWDARLTSTAIMLMIYAGYLALRAFTDDPERRARWSAWVGILAFINIPIVYMSVRWWRTLHQVQSPPRTMDRTYYLALLLNALAMTAVLIWFIGRRYHAAKIERLAEARREEVALAGGGDDV